MLTKEAVLEWKEIYQRETERNISFEEASEKANRMFNFLKTVTKPTNSKKISSYEGGDNNDKKTNR